MFTVLAHLESQLYNKFGGFLELGYVYMTHIKRALLELVFFIETMFRVPETHFVSSDTRLEGPEMIFSKLVTSLECPKCRHTFPLI
jgi:hypothetical protein